MTFSHEIPPFHPGGSYIILIYMYMHVADINDVIVSTLVHVCTYTLVPVCMCTP